jgi:hypothetical protein
LPFRALQIYECKYLNVSKLKGLIVRGTAVGEFFEVTGNLEEPGFNGALLFRHFVHQAVAPGNLILKADKKIFQIGKAGLDLFKPTFQLLGDIFHLFSIE